MPHAPTHNGIRVDARAVPRAIRKKAYKLFEWDRAHARRFFCATPHLAATNKCLAQNNKSRTDAKATKKQTVTRSSNPGANNDTGGSV